MKRRDLFRILAGAAASTALPLPALTSRTGVQSYAPIVADDARLLDVWELWVQDILRDVDAEFWRSVDRIVESDRAYKADKDNQ